ncbi:MAG: endonuclease VIII [Xanthomonadales bacterium]|nr:endonuclease VIII [Xanthomonadales bacterium]
MPEGPEIKRVADQLESAVAGKPLEEVWFARPDLQQYQSELGDSIVTGVKTKGKALLTEFDCGLTVYSHNQLYGRWYFMGAGKRPRTGRQLRWRLDTEDRSALLYSASEIAVMPSEEIHRHPFVARAGIDVLSDHPTVAEMSRYINQSRFARRSLGALLLDQGFVAGIGNYLRTEILFCAGLLPEATIGALSGRERSRLARQIIRITERAYQTGGITNDPKIVRRLKARGWRRSQYRHYAFCRAGEPCHVCAEEIRKHTVAGRRLYTCPHCQDHPAFTAS